VQLAYGKKSVEVRADMPYVFVVIERYSDKQRIEFRVEEPVEVEMCNRLYEEMNPYRSFPPTWRIVSIETDSSLLREAILLDGRFVDRLKFTGEISEEEKQVLEAARKAIKDYGE